MRHLRLAAEPPGGDEVTGATPIPKSARYCTPAQRSRQRSSAPKAKKRSPPGPQRPTSDWNRPNSTPWRRCEPAATTADLAGRSCQVERPSGRGGQTGEAAAQLPILALLDQAAGQAARVLASLRAAPHHRLLFATVIAIPTTSRTAPITDDTSAVTNSCTVNVSAAGRLTSSIE
jgi:hypothetical protein